MSDTIKLEKIDNGNNPNFSAYREIGTPEEEIQYWKVSYEKRTKQNQELKSERDEARNAIVGWENKWKCAVDMAARAEIERDDALEEIRKLKIIIDYIERKSNE